MKFYRDRLDLDREGPVKRVRKPRAKKEPEVILRPKKPQFVSESELDSIMNTLLPGDLSLDYIT